MIWPGKFAIDAYASEKRTSDGARSYGWLSPSFEFHRARTRTLLRWGLILCVAGVTHAELFAQDDEDEEEQPWNVSVATRYQNRFTRLGVDLSQDQPALTMEGGQIGRAHV